MCGCGGSSSAAASSAARPVTAGDPCPAVGWQAKLPQATITYLTEGEAKAALEHVGLGSVSPVKVCR